MRETLSQQLARSPLFSTSGSQELAELAACARERRYAAGQVLFLEGEPCQGLHVLLSGTVKLSKISPSGREMMLAIEKAPCSIAEVPLFDDGPYPATATALQESRIALLPTRDFRRICQNHPQLALRMLAVVGQRLRHLVGLVEALTFGTVRQRLARQLLEFAQAGGGQEFALPISQEELARRLGTVREVVSRNLSRFQSQGLLQLERRQLRILDAAGLQAEAEWEFHQ